jgi:hypothetical protein
MSNIDSSISVRIATMVVSIMVAMVTIFVAVPVHMTCGATSSVGAVKRRDDAATQNDGS